MNPKIRSAILAVILLGVVGLIVALARGNGSGVPEATFPPQSPAGATVQGTASGSSTSSAGPIVPPTPTLKPRPTDMVTTYATGLPESYFDLTVAIATSATEVTVGDTITVTLAITNTGKLMIDMAYCFLGVRVEGGSPDVSFVEPYTQEKDADGLRPGEKTTCTFTVTAVRPADEVMLYGGYVGKVFFSPDYESDKGGSSPIIKVKVKPENP